MSKRSPLHWQTYGSSSSGCLASNVFFVTAAFTRKSVELPSFDTLIPTANSQQCVTVLLRRACRSTWSEKTNRWLWGISCGVDGLEDKRHFPTRLHPTIIPLTPTVAIWVQQYKASCATPG